MPYRRLQDNTLQALNCESGLPQLTQSVLCLQKTELALKYLEYDAFGNITLGTKSEWEFSLGFTDALNDFYTGLVRFGFRDYDPQVGRFTAKDPIGDTGGDHDLWDYCVDDPISKIDPNGLWTRETFDESRISREDIRRFAFGGNGSASTQNIPNKQTILAQVENTPITEPYLPKTPFEVPNPERK